MTFYSNPIANPSLVEPGMKYFIDKTLKNCHKVRFEYSNFIHNLLLFLILMLVLGGFLIIMYKGKPTSLEIEQKERKKKEYILSKIKMAQGMNSSKKSSSLITDLPQWTPDSNFDLLPK